MVAVLKTFIVRFVACCFVLSGLWLALTQTQSPPPLDMVKVLDDLHILPSGAGRGCNVAVLTTPEGVLLVDDKFEQNYPQIVEKVKSLTDRPIRYVLNTHHHNDHTGGNRKLIDSAEIVCHQNARENMVREKQDGVPRVTFTRETTIHLGANEVRALHLGRGHTNGDAVILFPRQRVLHTGDLFVNAAPFIDYPSGGSGLDWAKTLEEVLKLDFDIVIPGHGPVMKRPDLATWRQSLVTATSRLRTLRQQGKDKNEAGVLLKVDDLPNFTAIAFWKNQSVPGLYDELGK
jgi:cyclase